MLFVCGDQLTHQTGGKLLGHRVTATAGKGHVDADGRVRHLTRSGVLPSQVTLPCACE
jgi:hypothetical protein